MFTFTAEPQRPRRKRLLFVPVFTGTNKKVSAPLGQWMAEGLRAHGWPFIFQIGGLTLNIVRYRKIANLQ